MATGRAWASVGSVLVVAMLAAGCTPLAVQPSPTADATVEPTVTPTPEPDPELVPGGTAGQNRPFFDFVIDTQLASNSQPSSREIVDSLTAAGFDKATMEVTADTTPVGQRADSILFSVQIDGQCLVGQVKDGVHASQLAEVLGTGRCLVGRTVSIDW